MNLRLIILLCILGYFSAGCQNVPCVKVADERATEARRQLLAPERHDIHLSGADVPTALRKIHELFGWSPDPETNIERDEAFVKDVRVTINRNDASLAEVFADLCNQTGFKIYEDFIYVGIYGAVGKEETGGRNLAYAKDGLLLILSFSLFFQEEPRNYSIFPRVVDSVPWLYHDGARLQIDELKYPDGTRLTNLGEDTSFCDIPLAPLVANHGLIEKISGTLSIQLPLSVVVRQFPLDIGKVPMVESGAHNYVRVIRLDEAHGTWTLECEYGHYSLKQDDLRLDFGYIDVLDTEGAVMQGTYKSVGGGPSGPPDPDSVTRECKAFEKEYKVRPSAIRWTYVETSEEYRIPVRFDGCRVPDIIWSPSVTAEK